MLSSGSKLRLRLRNERHPYTGLPLWWYERACSNYDDSHPEIFNPIEQERLRAALRFAVSEVDTSGSGPKTALDLGCGSGNVTAHLVSLGLRVIAADVSPFFLDLIRARFGENSGVETLEVNGSDLSTLPDDSLDMVATYSVLHHVHDYLSIIDELVRVTRPGGVIYLDHEMNENVWHSNGCLERFRRALRDKALREGGWWNPEWKRWQRLLSPSRNVIRAQILLRRLIPPASRLYPPFQFEQEVDIHVWPWDHIEWDRIEGTLGDRGCEVLSRQDYLLYRAEYPVDTYESYKDVCSDMRLLVARKRGEDTSY